LLAALSEKRKNEAREPETARIGADMQGPRAKQARRKAFNTPAMFLTTLAALPIETPMAFADFAQNRSNPDWPCQQVLVGRLSVAGVWSGPSIDSVDWRDDRNIFDLVLKTAARRLPLEEAQQAIEDFANAQKTGKTEKLTAVFAGLFETLDEERAQVIEGLLRFGAKQKALAEKIRNETTKAHGEPGEKNLKPDEEKRKAAEQQLEWDLRLFEERRQSLRYVCESPALIEQRLFALARFLEEKLE